MFETFSAVILLIVFLVPGFVWRTVEEQFIYLDKRLEWEKFALGLLARSSFIYLPFSSWIYQGWSNKWYETHPFWTALAAIGFILLLPAILGFLSGIVRQQRWILWLLTKVRLNVFEPNRIPTAWDALFSRQRTGWVIVTLKNATKVHGYMAKGSIVSSDYQDRDIYISIRWYRIKTLWSLSPTPTVYICGQTRSAPSSLLRRPHEQAHRQDRQQLSARFKSDDQDLSAPGINPATCQGATTRFRYRSGHRSSCARYAEQRQKIIRPFPPHERRPASCFYGQQLFSHQPDRELPPGRFFRGPGSCSTVGFRCRLRRSSSKSHSCPKRSTRFRSKRRRANDCEQMTAVKPSSSLPYTGGFAPVPPSTCRFF